MDTRIEREFWDIRGNYLITVNETKGEYVWFMQKEQEE